MFEYATTPRTTLNSLDLLDARREAIRIANGDLEHAEAIFEFLVKDQTLEKAPE